MLSLRITASALDGFFSNQYVSSGGWFSNHAVLFLAIIGFLLSGKYSEVFLNIKTHSKLFYSLFNMSYISLVILLFFSL
jgi:hypothetical protein